MITFWILNVIGVYCLFNAFLLTIFNMRPESNSEREKMVALYLIAAAICFK